MTKTYTSVDSSLGADLRTLRKARRLTLSDLAEHMDRSVGWMSQVERDISQPSISELRALAEKLGVSMSLFFGQTNAVSDELGRIVRAADRRKIGGCDAGLVEELLSPDLTDDFEMLRSEFAPNSSAREWVSRKTQEVGYLVSGKLTLWIDNHQYNLNAGDSFRIRGEKYRWQNKGSESAVAIWVINPPVY